MQNTMEEQNKQSTFYRLYEYKSDRTGESNAEGIRHQLKVSEESFTNIIRTLNEQKDGLDAALVSERESSHLKYDELRVKEDTIRETHRLQLGEYRINSFLAYTCL